MEKNKYRNYLEPRESYTYTYGIDESRYDAIKDFTFDLWFNLKAGASLKDAVLAFAEEMGAFGRTCTKFAICVLGDDAVNELGEDKDSLLCFCAEKDITVLRDEGAVYYNYHDGREYCIVKQEGYGMVDDAATYLFLWWNRIPTEEEEEKERLRQKQQERQRAMYNGKSVCMKYCLNDMEQIEILEKRLQEMKRVLEVKELELRDIAGAQLKRMKIHDKIRAIEINRKGLADAKEYLLSPRELEEKK